MSVFVIFLILGILSLESLLVITAKLSQLVKILTTRAFKIPFAYRLGIAIRHPLGTAICFRIHKVRLVGREIRIFDGRLTVGRSRYSLDNFVAIFLVPDNANLHRHKDFAQLHISVVQRSCNRSCGLTTIYDLPIIQTGNIKSTFVVLDFYLASCRGNTVIIGERTCQAPRARSCEYPCSPCL